jgi:hypothetical protein
VTGNLSCGEEKSKLPIPEIPVAAEMKNSG